MSGPVPTEFQARAGMTGTTYPPLLTRSAEQVAEEGYRGLKAGRRVVVPGFANKMVTAFTRFVPPVAAHGHRPSPKRPPGLTAVRASPAPVSWRLRGGHALKLRHRRVIEFACVTRCSSAHAAADSDRDAPRDVDAWTRRPCASGARLPLDMRRPRLGDPLPGTMAEHAGAIFFGGPMSANDTDDFVRREIDWLAVPLRERKPFLGICLGAQMLAHHLGSRVFRHPDGHAEVGYYPIRPTEIGRAVCDPWPEQVYQWHREGFDLPLGAELLAEGDSFPVQAFRYGGRAYAFQFHPDVTHATMCRWTTRPRAHGDAQR